MRYQYYILLLLVIATNVVYGQNKSKFKKAVQQQTPQEMLAQAKSLKVEKPQASIDLINQLITQNKKSQDKELIIKSYILLGSIYEDIRQYALGIDRYKMAITIMQEYNDPKSNGINAQLPELYRRIANLNLNLLQYDAAAFAFNTCIDNTDDNQLAQLCHEGILDVMLRQDSLDAFLDKASFVRKTFPQDSISTSRMDARMSEYYLKKSDFSYMQNSFQNSILNVPSRANIDVRDLEPITQAQNSILTSDSVSIQDKLAVQSGVIALNERRGRYRIIGDDSGIRSNYRKAELYESDSDPNNAKTYIDVSKSLITKTTKSATKADVYKKSAEYNQRIGKVTLALDDLEKYIDAKEKAITELEAQLAAEIEIIKKQQSIDLNLKDALIVEKEDKLYENQLKSRNVLIGLLSLLLFASMVYFYFLYQNIKEKNIANKRLELRSLNAQMNPHFVFNALNAVNNFISKNDEISANKFLTDFSLLMRKVLHHSESEFVSLEEEVELIQLYTHLEQFRFRDKFDVRIENKLMDGDQQILVPPMLIQPYIENAVWHGLRYKESRGLLHVIIESKGEFIEIHVVDNGIGRKKSAELKTQNQRKYRSTGMSNAEKRIGLLSEINSKNYGVSVSDRSVNRNTDEGCGTIVIIKIPKIYE